MHKIDLYEKILFSTSAVAERCADSIDDVRHDSLST